MEIADIVNIVPSIPRPGEETGRDIRTELHLLYKEGNFRLDALCLPFGEDFALQGASNALFLRYLPDGKVKILPMPEAVVKKTVRRDGSHYITLQNEDARFVVPFLANDDFPRVIMPNSFTQGIAAANDGLVKDLVDTLAVTGILLGDRPLRERAERLKERTTKPKDMIEMVADNYNPLRAQCFEAFDGLPCPSRPLSFIQRKSAHYGWKCIDKGLWGNDDRLKSLYLFMAKSPFLHSFFSTEENKGFLCGRSEKSRKDLERTLGFLKSEDQEAYEGLLHFNRNMGRIAAKTYESYLIAGAIGSLVLGHPLLALSLGAGFFVERHTSRKNARSTGYSTGVIGSVRDALGLTKKIVSPYDLISEEYDLGFWRGKDFKAPPTEDDASAEDFI